MDYLEINVHTAQKRLHNDVSVSAALKRDDWPGKSKGKRLLNFPFEGDHSFFREAAPNEIFAQDIRRANPDGSWGFDEMHLKCPTCNGRRNVEIKPNEGKAYTLPCYNCTATGYISKQELLMRDLTNNMTAEEVEALENAELREAAAVSFVQAADEEDLVGCDTGEDHA